MNLKPVVILDDSPSTTEKMAQGIRRFSGFPTVYFRSVPAFERGIQWKYEDGLPALAEKLKSFSAIVCDNNFEAQNHDLYSDGWVRGIDFLVSQVGPAVNGLPENERPYLVCFSPSSEEVVKQYEGELWDNFRIASFHRIFEGLAVGLAIRFSKEYQVPFSREAVICQILGFAKEYPDDFRSPKFKFFVGLDLDYLREVFQGEEMWYVQGEGKGLVWEELIGDLAKNLGLENDQLLQKIEFQAELLRAKGAEGQVTGRNKEIK